MKKEKLYPESKVELTPFIARNYDMLLKVISLGRYGSFLKKAVQAMELQAGMQVLDLGCGSGHNASLMLPYLRENGGLTGIDISPEMEQQFRRRFQNDRRVSFVNQRIDVPFDLGQRFDAVFMSFVLHGFPHEVRATILDNVSQHLKPGGYFLLLDFSEFDMQAMPRVHHWIFTHVECVYAFDFVGRSWKDILAERGFGHMKETFYLKNYVRLLKAQKL